MKRASVMGFVTVGLIVAASWQPFDSAAGLSLAQGRPFDSAAASSLAQGKLAAAADSSSLVQEPAAASQEPGKPGQKADATQARLGSIRLPKNVLADGKPLPAGTYQLRLTGEEASPTPAGQTPGAERWVEFLRGSKVVGRELATVVPDSEIGQIAEGHGKPARNGQRVDLLKTQKYWRVWMHRGANHYLIHLPPAEKGNG